MVDLVIGDERSNLTLSVPSQPRLYSAARLDIFDARGSFSVEGFRGEFQTMLSAPIAREFAAHVRALIDGSAMTLCWWGGIDNEPDFQVELTRKDTENLKATVSFNVSMVGATSQVYDLQSTDWSFEGGLFFVLNRRSLDQLDAALRTLQFESRQ